MKTLLRNLLLLLVAGAAACTPRERTIVLLSTNDMHAKIQHFPRLAAAVEACRDTTQSVILADAGDRWTGNAYVDRTPMPGMPMIALMNRLGYDVATLGNHEFDHGQAFLGRMLDSMDFEIVCSNVVSDTCTFPQLPPYTILQRDGIRIGIVGAVTNYEGPGHPAGNTSSFVGLRFPDPQEQAARYAAELRPKVDLLVLLSHMGDDRDQELLERSSQFDLVIGGHTHELRDTLVGRGLLTQTGKNLTNIGVTKVHMRGRKIERIDYELVPLASYEPAAEYQQLVDDYYADPELNRPIGTFAHTALKVGLANWMAATAAEEARADIGVYHIGGVRLDSIPQGGVSTARVYDLEPFGTRIAEIDMTVEDLRRMIVTKYNEPTREGHRLDLIATVPYTIVVDADDRARTVLFPGLSDRRVYHVAISDYVFKNYHGIEREHGSIPDRKVSDALFARLASGRAIEPDNALKQKIVREAN